MICLLLGPIAAGRSAMVVSGWTGSAKYPCRSMAQIVVDALHSSGSQNRVFATFEAKIVDNGFDRRYTCN